MFQAKNAREVEDVVVACPECGEFATGLVLGQRDWLARRAPHGGEQVFTDELQRELLALVRKARGAADGEDEDEGEGEGEGEGDDAGDDAGDDDDSVVTVERVEVDGREDDEIDCDHCQAGLGVTWGDLAVAHARLSGGQQVWLEGYVRMKDMARCALFLDGVAVRTGLGLFINVTTRVPGLRAQAMPLFVASRALADKVAPDVLAEQAFVYRLASEESCRAGDLELQLPTQYDGPRVTVDLEVGVGLDEIAAELRATGRAPLRGLGTLRRLEYTWDDDAGTMIYLDFDEALRAAVDEAVDDGERDRDD